MSGLLPRWSARIVRAAGGFAVGVGGVALVGWFAGLPLLTSVGPGLATMKANTAAAAALAGLSLFALTLRSTPLRTAGLAAAVGLIALTAAVLVQYATRFNLGIDEFLVRDATTNPALGRPGRMAAATAVLFLLVGGELVLLHRRLVPRFAQGASWFAFGLSLIPILGYLYGAEELYSLHPFATLALNTAVVLLVLNFGALAAAPNVGLKAILTSPDVEGTFARRLVPAALVVPIALAWVRLKGQQAGWYNTEFGLALFASSNVVVFLTLIFWNARWLARTDVDRRRATALLIEQNATLEHRVDERTAALREREEWSRALIDGVRDYAIFRLDPAGRILTWNAGAAHLSGYAAAEIVGQHFSRLYTPDDIARDWPAQVLRGAEATGRFEDEGWRVRKDGSTFWANAVITALHDRDGRAVGFSKVTRDLTQRKQAEEALRRSEERFRAIFHSQFQFIGLMALDGTLLEANRTALAAAGVEERDVLGRPFWETAWWRHDAAQRERLKAAVATAAGGEKVRFEASHPAPDGALMWVDFSLTPYRNRDGEVTLLIPEGRDITERKAVEAVVRDQERRFRAIFDTAFQFIGLMTPDGTLTEANASALAARGIPRDRAIGRPLWETPWFDGIDSRAEMIADVRRAATGELVRHELTIRGTGDQVLTIDFSIKPILDDAGAVALLLPEGHDITELKRAERELRLQEERFRSAFDFAAIGMGLVSPNGRWLRVNRSLCELVGYTPEELLQIDFQTITHPDDLQTDLQYVHQMLRNELQTYSMEKRYFHKTGRTVYILLSVSLVRDDRGEPLYFISQIQDISQRKIAEARIRESLAEKEVLLREIHHRVKNNLAVIGSLFYLESTRTQDAETLRVLEECQTRIRAMALVHESLYQADDLANVHFQEYAGKLATQLFRTYALDADAVRLRANLSDVRLKIDQAIPCGLILNELIANALKHAFPHGRAGTIELTLEATAGRVVLSVTDDGVGLPDDAALAASRSLGLRLIQSLTRQLDARFEFVRLTPGTAARLTLEVAP